MTCPNGSAPSVVGNDSFKGILVWECVKTWQKYESPVSFQDSDASTPQESSGDSLDEVAATPQESSGDSLDEVAATKALADSTILANLLTGQSIQLSKVQQAKRLEASVGVANGLTSGELSVAARAAESLTSTYLDVAVSALPTRQARILTRELRSDRIESSLESQVRERTSSLVRNDINKMLVLANVEQPVAVSKALADSRVQSLLSIEKDKEVSRQARLAMTGGNLPAVAGILQTEELIPRIEYRIAEALSMGKLAEAQSLAARVTSFRSSVVSLALQELLVSQGQTSTSAKVVAAGALANGKLRSGAWHAFQGAKPQACSEVGCAWLGNSVTR